MYTLLAKFVTEDHNFVKVGNFNTQEEFDELYLTVLKSGNLVDHMILNLDVVL